MKSTDLSKLDFFGSQHISRACTYISHVLLILYCLYKLLDISDTIIDTIAFVQRIVGSSKADYHPYKYN
jgi:hypothetical protein